MESKKFDFWQHHSLHYLEMAFRKDRRVRGEHPDGYGKRTGECGDTVEIYLYTRNGRIRWQELQRRPWKKSYRGK